MRPENPVTTQVLIVGAGPAGLALAIELGHRKIPCLLIEKNDRVGYAPRAKTTNVRTREHMRRWGIADTLRAASPLGLDYPSNVVFVTRLSGYGLAKIENAMYCAPGKNPFYSEHGQWIPQYTVEEVMRAHAESLPEVEIRFGATLDTIEQSDHGVRARVHQQSGSDPLIVQASYLVGADGARSAVRTAIGAKMEGAHGLSRNFNVVFRAPGLAQAHQHGPAIMYWLVNDDYPGLIGPMDSGDRWFFMPTKLREGASFNADDAPDLIRKATGIKEQPIEILSTDEWVASRLLADRYQDRRVFLIGDACHVHPPFGGYGMNMGVADAVDLGWKLGAVIQGWGGTELLASYQSERRPVHQMVMDEAIANHATLGNQLWQDGLEADTNEGKQLRDAVGKRIRASKLREFNTLGIMLGYRYDGSAIIASDGTVAPASDFINYVPSACPGSLAPHAWLHDGTSLYDHFGQGFTLLVTGKEDATGSQSALVSASVLGLPLKILQPAEPVLASLYQARFTLIRPDQHVAWRGDVWPENGVVLMRKVTGWSNS